MKETDYAYAVAYTRTLENKMLTQTDFEALLNSASPEAALRLLSEKGYGKATAGPALSEEDMLNEESSRAWSEAVSACPDGAPFEILLYQNDFHNLKTILKAVFCGAPYERLTLAPYAAPPEIIYRAASDGALESLPGFMREPAEEAYHILARDGDGQAAEILLDKALFAVMRQTAERSGSDFIIGWVDLLIALADTKTARRGGAREAMIGGNILSGAPDGPHAELELWCDNTQISYLQAARYKAFGFEPVLGFMVGKQFELQSVRIILSGLRRGVPARAMRERMRDSYI